LRRDGVARVVSEIAFTLFLLALALERGFELALSRENAAWSRARGAIEYGQGHLPWMKLLHIAFFAGCLLEVWFASPPFRPVLAAVCLVVVLGSQALRYWAIATLGRRWNVAVLVLSGTRAEAGGPFRFVKHPNYVAVVLEGLAVPLMHSAFVTAVAFTISNACLLWVRIRCEERALSEHCEYAAVLGDRPRFLPTGSSPS
jgi:methyltransferase